MGQHVTLAEAAQLVNRHERILRWHIKERGDLPAVKAGRAWRVDVEDLERIAGWRVDRSRLAQLAAHEPRSVETMAARLAAVERELRDVRARLRMLEQRGTSAPVSDDALHLEPPESPYNANLVQVPAPAPGDFPSRQAVARFLGRHGIPEPTARSWYTGKPWPATPRDALADVLRRLNGPDVFRLSWRHDFARCDDASCPCHELLPATPARA